MPAKWPVDVSPYQSPDWGTDKMSTDKMSMDKMSTVKMSMDKMSTMKMITRTKCQPGY